jgi:hypothetical protein
MILRLINHCKNRRYSINWRILIFYADPNQGRHGYSLLTKNIPPLPHLLLLSQ